MLTYTESAGVAPEVNLRITQVRKCAKGSTLALKLSRCRTRDELEDRTRKKARKRDPPWLWSPGQMLPEVQNRNISGPTKRTYVLQIYLKNSWAIQSVKDTFNRWIQDSTGWMTLWDEGGGNTPFENIYKKKNPCMKSLVGKGVKRTTILTSPTPPTPTLPLRSTNGLFTRTKSPENVYLPETTWCTSRGETRIHL